MGFWLGLPIGFPLSSCLWWPVGLWSISPLLEQYLHIQTLVPHSGVTSGSLPKMGNVLIFCNSSSYGLYCSVYSAPSSTKSLTITWGPSLLCSNSMNKLCSCLHSSYSNSSWVSAEYLDLWRSNLCYYLCHHGRTNIDTWAWISTQFKMIICKQ